MAAASAVNETTSTDALAEETLEIEYPRPGASTITPLLLNGSAAYAAGRTERMDGRTQCRAQP